MLTEDKMVNYEWIAILAWTDFDGKGTGWERTTHVIIGRQNNGEIVNEPVLTNVWNRTHLITFSFVIFIDQSRLRNPNVPLFKERPNNEMKTIRRKGNDKESVELFILITNTYAANGLCKMRLDLFWLKLEVWSTQIRSIVVKHNQWCVFITKSFQQRVDIQKEEATRWHSVVEQKLMIWQLPTEIPF